MPGGFTQSYSHPWKKNAAVARTRLTEWERQQIIDQLQLLKDRGGALSEVARLERLLIKDRTVRKRNNY